MAKWYEGANEASFKAVPGGYVFQCPNPWVFARPRYYLVNDSQKTEILGHLGRWRALLLSTVLLTLVTMIVLVIIINVLPPRVVVAFIWVPVVVGVAAIAMSFMPHLYLMRKLAPIVATLSSTDQRITVSEQVSATAANVATSVLVLGAAGGLIMVLGGIIKFGDAISNGTSGLAFGVDIGVTIVGLLLMGGFVRLLMKKRAKAS